jgi:undecaprenyl diphosphate synthase
MDPVPRCIGIILDGNRRWAKEKGQPTLMGHREGAVRLKECARWCKARGVANLVVFAFSTENWKRAAEEVSYLMDLMREVIVTDARELMKEGMRIKIVGEHERLPVDLQKSIAEIETESADNTRMTLWVCISYGGRAEITAAAKSVAKDGVDITEESLRERMWTAGMPDPDILIRTGGRHRISNFLLWQCAYSEIFFSETMWPDFSEKELDEILVTFAERERTYGA